MRALISIYHQSENFITPENLSEMIDDAFIYNIRYPESVESDYYALEGVVAAQKRKPKVGMGVMAVRDTVDQDEMWSASRPKRETLLLNALFGTEGKFKPGLEMVEDEFDRVKAKLEEEKQEQAKRRR